VRRDVRHDVTNNSKQALFVAWNSFASTAAPNPKLTVSSQIDFCNEHEGRIELNMEKENQDSDGARIVREVVLSESEAQELRSLLLQVSGEHVFSVSYHLLITFKGMPILPDFISPIEANAAKVAYAFETLDIIQAEAFIAECAYRRSIASSIPLKLYMIRKRDVLDRARVAFKDLCLTHTPRIPLRFTLPDGDPATYFAPTTFPPGSDREECFVRGKKPPPPPATTKQYISAGPPNIMYPRD
jgi:hypothetical protein